MRVRILKPSVSVMQSSCGCGKGAWRIEPELETPRVIEPLMGWVSAADPLSAMAGRLRFDTEEEAVTFARKRGWELVVETSNIRHVVPKSYVDQFNPDRRRDGR